MECILAATTSGSAIASLAVWQTNKGKVMWTFLSVLSALLAIYKSLAKLQEKLIKVDKVLLNYYDLEHELKMLTRDIRDQELYTIDLRNLFKELMKKKQEIIKNNPGLNRKKKLETKCRETAQLAYPAENFFIPKNKQP